MLRVLSLVLLGAATLTACEPSAVSPALEGVQTETTSLSVSSRKPVQQNTPDVERQTLLADTAKQRTAEDFKTVEWTELIPKDDLDALLDPPAYVAYVEDGSSEDKINSQLKTAFSAASDDRYQQALTSGRIVEVMDKQAIRIAGFIVPLEFDDEQTITQFFLVPFFGACIHVPPPPPNQIIFVNYPQGLTLNALYDPFWISGVLTTSAVENEMAAAAYSMQMQSYEAYAE